KARQTRSTGAFNSVFFSMMSSIMRNGFVAHHSDGLFSKRNLFVAFFWEAISRRRVPGLRGGARSGQWRAWRYRITRFLAWDYDRFESDLYWQPGQSSKSTNSAFDLRRSHARSIHARAVAVRAERRALAHVYRLQRDGKGLTQVLIRERFVAIPW